MTLTELLSATFEFGIYAFLVVKELLMQLLLGIDRVIEVVASFRLLVLSLLLLHVIRGGLGDLVRRL